ncbi:DUF2680 domain-containing protein [Bacillus salipaludis]|uniref:DUF2680 domain-containing protein n=1 Tax=Bacillus salipaludis TaxID=2547811 RepID=A0AA90R7D2_9BACI|nr:DUF2680 domain-containing protein [Bacillus salipaludis]MDQ6597216.1 DUF2680 domain-containing protein [Bacillus salipaludis]
MIKKYVSLIFFLFCFIAAGYHANAEKDYEKKDNELEKVMPLPNKEKESELDEKNNSEKESDGEKKDSEKWDSDLTCTKDIKYTLAQKQSLDQIYHRIYMDYISLIETYAWAGALTQDEKNLRYNMLRNYILTFQKRNYKWCSEFEEDEWEEEWFNSDND